MGKAAEEPDPQDRLNTISEHVVEACYLAHERGAGFLAHLLKMALTELESLGAFRADAHDRRKRPNPS